MKASGRTAFRRQFGARPVDGALFVVALIASAIPVIRERLTSDAGMMGGAMVMPDAIPVGVAHVAIAVKVSLAVVVLALVLAAVGRRRYGDLMRRLAASPLSRTAMLAAVAIAVGLSVFDSCTNYHGAEMDAGGTCSCWLTGTLAACGAFLASVAIAAGRVLVAFAREIVRAVIALVFRLLPRAGTNGAIRRHFGPVRTYRAPGLARRTAGRAPPREA
jgi:hypothetical protein